MAFRGHLVIAREPGLSILGSFFVPMSDREYRDLVARMKRHPESVTHADLLAVGNHRRPAKRKHGKRGPILLFGYNTVSR